MKASNSRHGLNSRVAQACFVAIGTALLAATPALAQGTGASVDQGTTSLDRKGRTADPGFAELQKEIRQRDALIQKLLRRVDRLEHQVQQVHKGVARRPGAAPSLATLDLVRRVDRLERQVHRSAPRPGTPPALVMPAVANSQAGAQTVHPALAAEVAPAVAQAAPPPPAAPAPAASAPAPGQFAVSPEAAERALERTLVATGNLLVPAGFAEVEPLFSYTRYEMPNQVVLNVNRNQISPAFDLRFGLPWESQLEMALPWNFAEQQVIDNAVLPMRQVSDRWGNGIGDFTIGAAKVITHEKFWLPTLIGRATWEAPTGALTASNGVALPSGQNKLALSLTALKRQDPLVFVGTASYIKAFTEGGINPGDQWNFTTGAFLATSPETTLRGVLTENFLQDVTIHGVTIPGSNTVQPILTFGASSILGRGILVDLQVGFGLTNSAPKYTVLLSSTYRFNLPRL